MHTKAIISILCVTAFLAGCTFYEEPHFADAARERIEPVKEEASSFTRLESIWSGQDKLGYLLTYLEVPPTSEEPQYFPPGTAFIKNVDFKNIGMVTDKGKTFRYTENQKLREVCQFGLTRSLAVFFDVPESQIALKAPSA